MDWYGAKNVGGEERRGKTSEKAGAWQMEIGERHDLRAQSVLHSVAALNDSAAVVIRLFCMNNNADPGRRL